MAQLFISLSLALSPSHPLYLLCIVQNIFWFCVSEDPFVDSLIHETSVLKELFTQLYLQLEKLSHKSQFATIILFSLSLSLFTFSLFFILSLSLFLYYLIWNVYVNIATGDFLCMSSVFNWIHMNVMGLSLSLSHNLFISPLSFLYTSRNIYLTPLPSHLFIILFKLLNRTFIHLQWNSK